jgi:hypothetical protein
LTTPETIFASVDLPAPLGAHQRDDFAARNGEVNLVKRLRGAKSL